MLNMYVLRVWGFMNGVGVLSEKLAWLGSVKAGAFVAFMIYHFYKEFDFHSRKFNKEFLLVLKSRLAISTKSPIFYYAQYVAPRQASLH